MAQTRLMQINGLIVAKDLDGKNPVQAFGRTKLVQVRGFSERFQTVIKGFGWKNPATHLIVQSLFLAMIKKVEQENSHPR